MSNPLISSGSCSVGCGSHSFGHIPKKKLKTLKKSHKKSHKKLKQIKKSKK